MRGRGKQETPMSLVRRYEENAKAQRAFVQECHGVQEALARLDSDFRCLLADDHFLTLLRAEGLDRIPSALLKRTEV
jgi:ParB family chromosome partitioning protein